LLTDLIAQSESANITVRQNLIEIR